MSSAHGGLDVRIFHKECISLANAGYDVHLIITASDKEIVHAKDKGITIHTLPLMSNRTSRMFIQTWRCFQIARSLEADIYHFHDAELIPYGILLSILGKKVVYDVHEDLPKDILSKNWIPLIARKTVALIAGGLEYIGAKHFFSISAATPSIASRFKEINSKAIDINNYPLIDEFSKGEMDWSLKSNKICYVGGIARIRGILEVVQAMGEITSGARLQLVGSFSETEVEISSRELPGWQQVDALGFLARKQVAEVMARVSAGLVTFLPMPNHIDAQPNKMFEYMSAGVPVIASFFPLWRQIIEDNACGLCVDPHDPAAIAKAIDFLVLNPEEAERMGRNGQRAVAEQYNWKNEEAKLFQLYASL